jgi:Gas vesicle synthesis protein GvpL/GvpF
VADLAGWAAARAPELVARAEAEAVEALRDALLNAALAGRRAEPVAEPQSPPPPPAAEDDRQLLWAYCVLPADAPAPPDTAGVDPGFRLERIEAGGLAALVSRVPGAEFGAEALRRNLNDLPWLERVARAHEEVLERVLPDGPIVPLRLCTLYEDDDGVRRMLESERAALHAAIDGVAGREEWGLKLLVDADKLAAEARASSSEAAAMADDLSGATEAGAYMLRRRLERHVREVADRLAEGVAAELRGRLESSGFDFVTRPPQNRDLSQHEGEMLLNAACLVDRAGLEQLQALAGELESAHAALGARVELTGPWPPYNFVFGGDAATLA